MRDKKEIKVYRNGWNGEVKNIDDRVRLNVVGGIGILVKEEGVVLDLMEVGLFNWWSGYSRFWIGF